MADLSVYQRYKTIKDFQDEEEAKQLNKAIAMQKFKQEEEQFNLNKMGDEVLVKAAMGLPLTEKEIAIGIARDAKSAGSYVDAAGNLIQKPKAFESIFGKNIEFNQGQNTLVNDTQNATEENSNDAYSQLREEVSRNKKLRQENLQKYSKQLPAAEQIKSALTTYASDLKTAPFWERTKTSLGIKTPLGTSYNNAALLAKGEELYNLGVLTGPDLQILQNALADPTTLSGAITSDDTVKKQVKKIISIIDDKMQGAAAGAGMFYKRSEPENEDDTDPTKEFENALRQSQEQGVGVGPNQRPELMPPQKGIVENGYMFNGGDPSNPKNWKKVK